MLACLLLSWGAAGCGADQKEDKSSDRSSEDATGNIGGKKKPPGHSGNPNGDDGNDGDDGAAADDGGQTDGGQTDGGSTDGASDGGPTDGSDTAEAEKYFNLTVVPILQVKCIGCHADPRMPVEVRAPLSIYSYKSMKAILSDGKASDDNAAFNRVRNVKAHTGGDRCKDGANVTPCKELITWWHLEYGEDTGTPKSGRVTEVTSLGKVYGYAYDAMDSTKAVTVKFFIDGDKDTGTAAGETIANFDGSDGNTPGAHAFNFTLPDAAKNGKAHTLMAYAAIGTVDVPLLDEPLSYTSYSFSTAGRNYYNASVKPAMGSCTGCHNVDYETQFYSMIAPSPAQGGTKTNNQLVNKPAVTNGVTSHFGGKLCSSVNASPCSVFQQWWTIEFGP